MPTPTFCYVLGGPSGPFPAMAFVSASALRRLYPGGRIVLLGDAATVAELRARFPALAEVAEVHAAPLHAKHPHGRSRELKMGLRELLDGDLVYLDADTLPLRRFDELFASGPAFAGVLDRNRKHRRPHVPKWVRQPFERMGWRTTLPRYFNSGVLFLPETPATRALAAEWRSRYARLRDELDVEFDQPALNSSLDALGTEVRVLPVEFNAMVQAWPYAARRARVLHFFAEGGAPAPDSLLAHLLLQLERTGSIDWASIDRARESGDPWIRSRPDVHRALATRHYGRAARIVLARATHHVGFDPVRSIGPRVFVADNGTASFFILRRLRKAGAPFAKNTLAELSERACVLEPNVASGQLAGRGVRGAVFVLSDPLDAYLRSARGDQKERIDALGGAESPAAQEHFAAQWRAAVREYRACRRAGLAPVLIRQDHAWEDAQASGDKALQALFERFDPLRTPRSLSIEGQQRLAGLLRDEQRLLEREQGDGHGDETAASG